jgi:hypothetical protein
MSDGNDSDDVIVIDIDSSSAGSQADGARIAGRRMKSARRAWPHRGACARRVAAARLAHAGATEPPATSPVAVNGSGRSGRARRTTPSHGSMGETGVLSPTGATPLRATMLVGIPMLAASALEPARTGSAATEGDVQPRAAPLRARRRKNRRERREAARNESSPRDTPSSQGQCAEDLLPRP